MPKGKTDSKSAAKSSAKTPVKAPIKGQPQGASKGAAKANLKAAAKPAAKAAPAGASSSKTEKGTAKNKKAAAPQVAAEKDHKKQKAVSTEVSDADAKKAKKVKRPVASKRADADEDLLAGESDGSEEVIEGLDEIEEMNEADVQEADDVEEVSADASTMEDLNEGRSDEEEIFLTDAEGRRLCRVRDCDQAAAVETYCRFHYLQNWKRIQVRRGILADGKLERYVEELTSRYPDKFLEMIRKDLRSEKDFLTSIAELEIDESSGESEFEDESQSFIEEVRGVSENNISDEEEF